MAIITVVPLAQLRVQTYLESVDRVNEQKVLYFFFLILIPDFDFAPRFGRKQ